jgi:hypothetical protein
MRGAQARPAQYSKNSAAKFLISGKISGKRHDPAAAACGPDSQPIGVDCSEVSPRRTELNGLFCGHTSARNYGVRNGVARTSPSALMCSRKRDPMCSDVSIESFFARAVR